MRLGEITNLGIHCKEGRGVEETTSSLLQGILLLLVNSHDSFF